jgi:hypothetical protein
MSSGSLLLKNFQEIKKFSQSVFYRSNRTESRFWEFVNQHVRTIEQNIREENNGTSQEFDIDRGTYS